MNIIIFNSGRLYQPEGQIIICRSLNDGVLFHDASRGVHGFIPQCELYHDRILNRYDWDEYENVHMNYSNEYDELVTIYSKLAKLGKVPTPHEVIKIAMPREVLDGEW